MSAPAGPVSGELNLIDPDGFLHGFPHETWRQLRAQLIGGIKHIPVTYTPAG